MFACFAAGVLSRPVLTDYFNFWVLCLLAQCIEQGNVGSDPRRDAHHEWIRSARSQKYHDYLQLTQEVVMADLGLRCQATADRSREGSTLF